MCCLVEILYLEILCLASFLRARDVGYLATVQMGTPPQNFLILMDSGSADFWVGSENCQSQAGGDCVRASHYGYVYVAFITEFSHKREITHSSGRNPVVLFRIQTSPSK